MSIAVKFQQLSKSFGPVQVLHGVSFELQPGLIYGLLGENGAGKSTLMKILSGYERPSGGELHLNGKAVQFSGPGDAEREGVILIHQEFNLVDDLNIAQNIFLGHEQKKNGILLDDVTMEAESTQLLDQVGLRRAATTKVRDLIIAEKQLVEIAKALSRKARLLIMDEPTATLTPGETERLFALVAQLRTAGTTIIYISHKLDEVERNTDRIVVMRDGRFVTEAETASVSRSDMARLMVGRELVDLYPPRDPQPDAQTAPALSVEQFSVPGWAQNISFDVRPGEILGFAGLVGAGRTELFEGLLGLRPSSGGKVRIGKDYHQLRTPRDAVQQGIAYLSEDRKGKGLHVNFGLRENLTLMALTRYTKPWLDLNAEQNALKQAVEQFGIRTGRLDNKASALSGGNQQKLALAKVLHPNPKVVVLDEPTRGVDVGAKREIYFLIQQLARNGLAVVIVSSELMELIGLCHRIAVMRNGALQTTLDNHHLTEEDLIAHATGTR